MLLPETRLDALIEQLADLPSGDRKAILAQLSRRERARLLSQGRKAASSPAASRHSTDVAQRLDALVQDRNDLPMTEAGRAALARAVQSSGGEPAEQQAGGSLVEALFGLFRSKAARR